MAQGKKRATVRKRKTTTHHKARKASKSARGKARPAYGECRERSSPDRSLASPARHSPGQTFSWCWLGDGSLHRRIVGRGKLHLEVERHWPALQSLWQFLDQEIRRASSRIGRNQMHEAVRQHLVADRLTRTRLVDEYERIDPVVLFISKAVRRRRGGERGCYYRP